MNTKQTLTALVFSVAVLTLTGCATGQNPDPYEGYNRKAFAFNRQVDKYVYRPAAKAYDTVTPAPVRTGIYNFFSNIRQLPIIGNDLLQGNFEWLVSDIGRLIINTTLGVGGLFDVATKAGIEKHEQDFGLTLAKWGVRESSYLVLPLLPSTTFRDGIGFIGDYFMSPWPYLDQRWGWVAYGMQFLETRASLLGPDKLIDEAFDPYIFMRDAHLQRRQAQIQRILHPHGDDSEEIIEDGNSDSENIENADINTDPSASGGNNERSSAPSKTN